MNREFLRREWGAVSFLIVTALGMVVVPIGLNLNRQNVSPAGSSLVSLPSPTPSAAASPSPSPSVSPSASASASASPSAAPSAAASASPAASPSASSSP
ncbi:MAG TPA: hypothetical protein VNV65_01650 [Candidatus Solibacter sp.]|nr:hypothetical protein [Candidatus Solibacter sp.]